MKSKNKIHSEDQDTLYFKMTDTHTLFANQLQDIEHSLANDKQIYDFHISKEKTRDNRPMLYCRVRYNDYQTKPQKDDINVLYELLVSLGAAAKKIGYLDVIIDMKTVSNNGKLYYTLV